MPEHVGPPAIVTRSIQAIGLARAGFGLYLALLPCRAGKSWFGTEPDRPGTEVLLRSVGGRDIAIGTALAAMPQSTAWLRVAMVGDFTDALAMAAAASRVPKRKAVIGIVGAAGFGMLAATLSRGLPSSRPSRRW